MARRRVIRGEPEVPGLTHGVRLHLSYDGTDFSGWQHQPGQRTVQGVIEEAIAAMGIRATRVRGASRTDSGVHAYGQVASFACDREVPPRGWIFGLNGLLPDDVAIQDAAPCHRRYNPRFDGERKLYRYLVYPSATRDPLLRRTTWFLAPSYARRDRQGSRASLRDYLDVEAMQEAAAHFLGTHDFVAFRAMSDDRENTERTLFDVRVLEGFGGRDEVLAIEVEGNAFLKNMVRILAGTLVDVGRKRFAPDDIPPMLAPGATRQDSGPTAPAQGLTLVRITLAVGDHPRRSGGHASSSPRSASPSDSQSSDSQSSDSQSSGSQSSDSQSSDSRPSESPPPDDPRSASEPSASDR